MEKCRITVAVSENKTKQKPERTARSSRTLTFGNGRGDFGAWLLVRGAWLNYEWNAGVNDELSVMS